MTKAELEFMSILRSAVHSEQFSTFSNPSWDDIISIAKKQNLFPLIYDAAQSVPGYDEVDLLQYFDAAVAQVSVQAQKTEEFLQLYKSFLKDYTCPIVLKGIICRSLYGERADFRASGDEDILIAKGDYKRAVQTLNRCGYHTVEKPDSNLDIVQEVTFSNPETSLIIELHLNPFGTYDSVRAGMNEWFRNVYDSKETLEIDGVSVRTLEPTDHILFLIFHAFKHFIGGGFGIRLMLDILLFAEKYYSCIDWEYVYRGLKAVGADEFYSDLVSIGNRYLGFKLPLCGKINTPEELLEDMLQMGTFGNSTTADHVASLFTSDAVQKGNRKKRKLFSMIQRLFPSWQSWTAWHPYLKDKPWMLPVEWVRRLFRYLHGQADMGNMKEINKSYGIAERRLELLKKYNVI